MRSDAQRARIIIVTTNRLAHYFGARLENETKMIGRDTALWGFGAGVAVTAAANYWLNRDDPLPPPPPSVPSVKDVALSPPPPPPPEDDFLMVKFVGDAVVTTTTTSSSTIGDVEYDKNVVTFGAEDTIRQVLLRMRRDATRVAVNPHSRGMFDLTDVLGVIRSEEATAARLDGPVDAVVHKLVCIQAGCPLQEALRHLAQWRYVSLGESSTPPRLVSQGAVLRFLVARYGATTLQTPLATSLAEAGLARQGAARLLVCPPGMRAREAFALMHAEGVTSLPCVDETGAGHDVISATDASYLGSVVGEEETARLLALPATEFIALSKKANPTGLISCTRESSLGHVTELMERHRVHHIYVVDEKVCDGVVSTVDVLTYLATQFATGPK